MIFKIQNLIEPFYEESQIFEVIDWAVLKLWGISCSGVENTPPVQCIYC